MVLTLPNELLNLMVEHLFQGRDRLPGHILRYRDVNALIRVSQLLYAQFNQKMYQRYVQTEGAWPLLFGSAQGSIATVQMALDAGADIRERGKEPERDLKSGGTIFYRGDAIIQAVANGQEATVRMLIKTGNIDLNPSLTVKHRSPLWWACQSGRTNMIKLLLSFPGTDINAIDGLEKNALYGAINGKQLKSVLTMLEYPQLDPKIPRAYNPTQYAIEQKTEEIACALIKDPRSDPNAGYSTGRRRYRGPRGPLVEAMRLGQSDAIRCLLERPDLEIANSDIGWTPIFLATCTNNPATVRTLLAMPETDPHTPDSNGQTPLMVAIRQRHPRTARALAGVRGTDFNHQDKNGNTALILAVSAESRQMISFLLKCEGVDPDIRNYAGYSAQMMTSRELSLRKLFMQVQESDGALHTEPKEPESKDAEFTSEILLIES